MSEWVSERMGEWSRGDCVWLTCAHFLVVRFSCDVCLESGSFCDFVFIGLLVSQIKFEHSTPSL